MAEVLRTTYLKIDGKQSRWVGGRSKMRVDISKFATWSLVLAGVLLLAITGRLDWLVVLIPASVVLGCAIMWMGGTTERRQEHTDFRHEKAVG